jgi:hypothetical protein
MIEHKIIWEKWNDPFGENLDELKWNKYDDKELDDETELLTEELIKANSKPIKIIASPLGLIPYNEYTASSKIFNFWVGHTNFNISKPIVGIIEKCDGVELLDIFTRYRFRIGIGKCFTDNEVMKSITDNILLYFGDKYGNIA